MPVSSARSNPRPKDLVAPSGDCPSLVCGRCGTNVAEYVAEANRPGRDDLSEISDDYFLVDDMFDAVAAGACPNCLHALGDATLLDAFIASVCDEFEP